MYQLLIKEKLLSTEDKVIKLQVDYDKYPTLGGKKLGLTFQATSGEGSRKQTIVKRLTINFAPAEKEPVAIAVSVLKVNAPKIRSKKSTAEAQVVVTFDQPMKFGSDWVQMMN